MAFAILERECFGASAVAWLSHKPPKPGEFAAARRTIDLIAELARRPGEEALRPAALSKKRWLARINGESQTSREKQKVEK